MVHCVLPEKKSFVYCKLRNIPSKTSSQYLIWSVGSLYFEVRDKLKK
jgi:hypothetical protein